MQAHGRIIDVTSAAATSDACVSRAGDSQYWYAAASGYGGSLTYTQTTNNTSANNTMVWNLIFDEAGTYAVEAYVDGSVATSAKADYLVRHEGQESKVEDVEQSAQSGWTSLGEFHFAEGGEQFVRLNDTSGEPWVQPYKKLVFARSG